MQAVPHRRALQYGNHRSVAEHMSVIWDQLCEDVRRQKCLFIKESCPAQKSTSSMGAVVTEKVGIIHDFSFEAQNNKREEGLNADTDSDSVPPCLCAKALSKHLRIIGQPVKKFPTQRILISKADVSDAFCNVRINPDEAKTMCYMVGEMVVIDVRLTFGQSGSPVFQA